MKATIYHNPRCSKSRQTLALLEENKCDIDIVQYLKTPPDAATLADLVTRLGVAPNKIMRTGESVYKEAREQLASMTNTESLDWLARNPTVIERPIVVTSKGARIGRPPESVLEIL